MKTGRQVTVTQTIAIVASSIIGVGILPLPLFAVKVADHGAPLLTLLGSLAGTACVLIVAVLGKRFPRQTIVQFSETVIGKWPARVINLILIVFFAMLTAFTAREFGEVVISSVLRTTPLEVTIIIMLFLGAVSARVNITSFAYIHFFYLPFILIPAWVIVFLSMKNAELINLLPVWGNDPHGVIGGILNIANIFQAAFVIAFVIPVMKQPGKAIRASFWGAVIAGTLYTAIAAATVSVFGPEQIRQLLWPTLELAKTTTFPANIPERMDAAFLALWVTAVFTTLLSNYVMTVKAIENLFRLKDYRMLAFFLFPFLFLMAMQPQSILQMYTTIYQVGRWGLALTVGYPTLLLLIAMIRGKRGNTDDKQAVGKTD